MWIGNFQETGLEEHHVWGILHDLGIKGCVEVSVHPKPRSSWSKAFPNNSAVVLNNKHFKLHTFAAVEFTGAAANVLLRLLQQPPHYIKQSVF